METVVLIDENNNPIGVAPKESVHTNQTPLHRGFSSFIFNQKNELLLTKRSSKKKTFPGVWTNTVCGHPAPGEDVIDAARRRLHDEVGLNVDDLSMVVSNYRYRCVDIHGIVENEICPILIGHTESEPKPNSEEVDEYKWIDWKELLQDMIQHKELYSPWSIEEAQIINKTTILSK